MDILYSNELLYFSKEKMQEEIRRNGDRVWNSLNEIREYLENNSLDGKHVVGKLGPLSHPSHFFIVFIETQPISFQSSNRVSRRYSFTSFLLLHSTFLHSKIWFRIFRLVVDRSFGRR